MKIRPIAPEDDQLVRSWLSPEIIYKITTGSPDSSKPAEAVIIETDDHVPVGIMELSSIDIINKNARFGILIADSRGKNLFLSAVKQFLNQSFHKYGLHKIYFRVPADNEHALKVNRYFGFIEEGIDREAVLINGQFKNIIIMSMTQKEFERKCQTWD